MPIPELNAEGFLPAGIHGSSLRECTMIEDEAQLARSCELIARMHRQIDEASNEALWPESTRKDYIIGVDNAKRKIQREVYEYLKQKYDQNESIERAELEREKELVA